MAQTQQEDTAGRGPSAERCALCGGALNNLASAQLDATRCCEPCYLDQCRGGPADIERAYAGFAEALVAALDLREHETGLHSKRVACHTLVLARQFVSEPNELQRMYWGALLHDIGKIGIPDAVLLKSGPLNAQEWELMRAHPEAGWRILAPLPGLDGAAQIVLCHEERYDGSGYPSGLRADAIPLGARLFAVIDTLDAMTSDRPYRRALDFDAAKSEILRFRGAQFDPLAVDAFLQHEETLRGMVALKCGSAVLERIANGHAH